VLRGVASAKNCFEGTAAAQVPCLSSNLMLHYGILKCPSLDPILC